MTVQNGDGLSREEYERTTKRADENVIEYDGIAMDVGADLVSYEIYQLMVEGWYERQEATMVRRYLPPDVDVVELGAGLGYVSCVIDDVLSPGRTHLAVEPNPAVVRRLEKTKELNDASYLIREGAYSAAADTVDLDLEGEYWEKGTHRSQDGENVPAWNLRQLCDSHDLSTFSLVMDVEGAEYELFLSELDLLEARCPLLIVEFHEKGSYSEEYGDELHESDFVLVDGLETVCVYRNTRFEERFDGTP